MRSLNLEMRGLNMKKADKYILLAIIILVVLSSLGVYISQTILAKPGATALISQDGDVIQTIDLSKVEDPYEFTIKSNNKGINTVYVEKDHIKFASANCPDQLCVKTGLLSRSNDIAVCLPHGLIIEIQGGSEGEIDILAH